MRATGGFNSFNFTSGYGTSASIGFVHGPWGGSYFDGYMVRCTSPPNERGGAVLAVFGRTGPGGEGGGGGRGSGVGAGRGRTGARL